MRDYVARLLRTKVHRSIRHGVSIFYVLDRYAECILEVGYARSLKDVERQRGRKYRLVAIVQDEPEAQRITEHLNARRNFLETQPSVHRASREEIRAHRSYVRSVIDRSARMNEMLEK